MPTPAIPDRAAGSTAVNSVTLPPGRDSAAMDQMNSGCLCHPDLAAEPRDKPVTRLEHRAREERVAGLVTCIDETPADARQV